MFWACPSRETREGRALAASPANARTLALRAFRWDPSRAGRHIENVTLLMEWLSLGGDNSRGHFYRTKIDLVMTVFLRWAVLLRDHLFS